MRRDGRASVDCQRSFSEIDCRSRCEKRKVKEEEEEGEKPEREREGGEKSQPEFDVFLLGKLGTLITMVSWG